MTAPTMPAFDVQARSIIAKGTYTDGFVRSMKMEGEIVLALQAAFAAGQQATPPAQSDAERERLAQWCDRSATAMHECGCPLERDRYDRIAQLLRGKP